jgi:hypothetical protein
VLYSIFLFNQRKQLSEDNLLDSLDKVISDCIDIIYGVNRKQKEKSELQGGIFRATTFYKDADTKILLQQEFLR